MNGKENVFLEFKRKFGVSIVSDKDKLDLEIGYNRADQERVAEYVKELLSNELSIYSKKTLKKCKLNHIVICKNLASRGERKGALAVPNFFCWTGLVGNYICLDLDATNINKYARAIVHHELYHLIDFVDDFNNFHDDKWKQLNGPKFVYRQDTIDGKPVRGKSGFISEYAKDAVFEDKAEIFSHMIVNYSDVEKQAKRDSIIKLKMERMKQLMKSFSEEFDDAFWDARAKQSANW